jgi:hypothetical protein
MKIKNEIEFVSFSDGICSIYSEDDSYNKVYKYQNLGFSNKTLGYNRAFKAKAAQVQTNKLIKIPFVNGIDNHDYLTIPGEGTYTIELIQDIYESNPQSKVLTLKQFEMHEVTSS